MGRKRPKKNYTCILCIQVSSHDSCRCQNVLRVIILVAGGKKNTVNHIQLYANGEMSNKRSWSIYIRGKLFRTLPAHKNELDLTIYNLKSSVSFFNE